LEKRDVRLEEIKLPFGAKGFKRCGGLVFDDTMNKTRRVWPHMHEMDGFFVAKLRKLSNFIQEDFKGTSMLHQSKIKFKPENINTTPTSKSKKQKISDKKLSLGNSKIYIYKSKLRKIKGMANFIKSKKELNNQD